MATDRVDLVDEDDARRVLLALAEQIPDTACADTDEHLDEVRARDREERNSGLARDRAREQRLPRARRADQQHTLRDPSAQARELLRVAQERDDLFELRLGFLDARDVREGHALRVLREQLRARLAEAHRLATTRLQLAEKQEPEPDEEQHGQPADQHRLPHSAIVLRGVGRLDPVLLQELREPIAAGRAVRGEAEVVVELAFDVLTLDRDRLDFASLEPREEVGVLDLVGFGGGPAEQAEDGQQHEHGHRQRQQVLVKVVQLTSGRVRGINLFRQALEFFVNLTTSPRAWKP